MGGSLAVISTSSEQSIPQGVLSLTEESHHMEMKSPNDLHIALQQAAAGRLSACFERLSAFHLLEAFHNEEKSTSYESFPHMSLLDAELIPLMEVDATDDPNEISKEILDFLKSEKPNSGGFAVSIECKEITTLKPLLLAQNESAASGGRIMALNVSNNHINDTSDSIFNFKELVHLQIGGNPVLCNFSNAGCGMWGNLPSSLLVLDLSYTSNLHIPIGSFLGCPQLTKLSLDGCDLSSTFYGESNDVEEGNYAMPLHEDASLLQLFSDKDSEMFKTVRNEAVKSIFYGLFHVKELSLKENSLSSVSALRGLSFFGKSTALRSLWLADNPALEVIGSRRAIFDFLHSELHDSGLQYIDGKMLITGTSSGVVEDRIQLNKMLQLDQHTSDMHLDSNMEKEFDAALKGEKDVGPVS